jgi:hypothetical protein
MSRGPSGRIVLEIDPETKRQLYTVLAHDGRTLKDWFVMEVNNYLRSYSQLRLPLITQPVAQQQVGKKTRR